MRLLTCALFVLLGVGICSAGAPICKRVWTEAPIPECKRGVLPDCKCMHPGPVGATLGGDNKSIAIPTIYCRDVGGTCCSTVPRCPDRGYLLDIGSCNHFGIKTSWNLTSSPGVVQCFKNRGAEYIIPMVYLQNPAVGQSGVVAPYGAGNVKTVINSGLLVSVLHHVDPTGDAVTQIVKVISALKNGPNPVPSGSIQTYWLLVDGQATDWSSKSMNENYVAAMVKYLQSEIIPQQFVKNVGIMTTSPSWNLVMPATTVFDNLPLWYQAQLGEQYSAITWGMKDGDPKIGGFTHPDIKEWLDNDKECNILADLLAAPDLATI